MSKSGFSSASRKVSSLSVFWVTDEEVLEIVESLFGGLSNEANFGVIVIFEVFSGGEVCKFRLFDGVEVTIRRFINSY